MTEEIYDLIIIGGGSAALSAGIYAGGFVGDACPKPRWLDSHSSGPAGGLA